jgi:ubiquinone/menaquinone biosynthesis C-methylase UbiE
MQARRAIAFTGLAALVTPRGRLLEFFEPALDEQMFEVGPGSGYYSLCVAPRPGSGRLAVLDIQRSFLDHAMRATAENGISNVVPTLGDARSLPYEDGSLDAAFLVSVLGEIPDQDAALRELHRVLRPGGRLVVSETMAGDPHVVTLRSLRKRAQDAGFVFERRLGSPLGYLARFARS